MSNDLIQAPESKSLSNYKPTTIQTGSGLLTIELTFISATDPMQAGNNKEAGLQILNSLSSQFPVFLVISENLLI
nr:hypothetical protein [uncultured Glaciecola sp.]